MDSLTALAHNQQRAAYVTREMQEGSVVAVCERVVTGSVSPQDNTYLPVSTARPYAATFRAANPICSYHNVHGLRFMHHVCSVTFL